MRSTYHTIYFDIKDEIVSGAYRYKDYLPSESVLCAQYNCAHNTVRKAIEALAREGFVLPVHGKGVRVLYQSSQALGLRLAPNSEPAGLESFRDMGVRTGFEPTTKVLSMSYHEVSETFAEFSGFEVGSTVLMIKRVRRFNGHALEHETNYFRADLVEGITADDVEYSVYHYLEEIRGVKLACAKRVLTLADARDEDYALLEMGDDTLVCEVSNVAYDTDGMVGELSFCRHVPRYFSFSQTTVRTAVSS